MHQVPDMPDWMLTLVIAFVLAVLVVGAIEFARWSFPRILDWLFDRWQKDPAKWPGRKP